MKAMAVLRFSLVAGVLSVLARPTPAQTVRLTTPSARLAEEFSAVRGVRELADGRG